MKCGVGEGGEGGGAFFFSSRCSFSCPVLSTNAFVHCLSFLSFVSPSPRLVFPSSRLPVFPYPPRL